MVSRSTCRVTHILNQKAGIGWTTYAHTGVAVPVFAQGVGGESVGCVIFLVTGLSRTGLSAFCGTVAGAVAACLLALLFGHLFKDHGAVVPYAETLLHVGFSQIDLTKVFIAQGTPVVNILNLTYIAAEILHTLVGSFGVVLVAPFTAILAGYLLVRQ